jgi:ubiquinone/menaquinone biosynthesis C-methylase UbiE
MKLFNSEVLSYADALGTLNGDGRTPHKKAKSVSDSDADHIKRAIDKFYSGALATGTQNCWNWGIHSDEIDRELRGKIPSYDKFGTDGFSEQFYYWMIKQVPITDFSQVSILDVGCGLGAGIHFISRAVECKRYVGLDQSDAAIQRANARLQRTRLSYVQGDAEKLPFGDNEFDIVTNVESAHNYPDLSKFLSEVHRVLKPGGYFSWTDALTKERHELLLQAKAKSPFKWVREEDISELVRAAIRRRIYPKEFGRTVHLPNANSFVERLFLKQMWMIIFGADFVGHQFDPLSRMFMNLYPKFKIAIYPYFLGRKE